MEDGREGLAVLRLFPAEDHVVIKGRRAGALGLVGRGVADDVAARHQVELPAGEEVGEALEILR